MQKKLWALIFMLSTPSLYAGFIFDLQGNFQSTSISSVDTSEIRNLRYQDSALQSSAATAYGINLGILYLSRYALSEKVSLFLGPFVYGGIGKYQNTSESYTVDRSLLFQPGYEFQISRNLSPKFSIYFKEDLGYCVEWIFWTYHYGVYTDAQYTKSFVETASGPYSNSFLGFSFQPGKRLSFYAQAGFTTGKFTSSISKTDWVKGSDSIWFKGFKINAGLQFRL